MDFASETQHPQVDPADLFGHRERFDFSLGLGGRVRTHIELVEGLLGNLFSVKQAPDLFVDLVTDCVLHAAEQKVHIFSVVGLKHADVVGSVDEAVTSDFAMELAIHLFTMNTIEEISEDLFVLSFHLHFIEFGHN